MKVVAASGIICVAPGWIHLKKCLTYDTNVCVDDGSKIEYSREYMQYGLDGGEADRLHLYRVLVGVQV